MKPNGAARIASVILALAGLAAILAAGIVATRQFTVTVPPKHYSCGSVLFPKNPINSVNKRKVVGPRVKRAAKECQQTSNDRAHTATTFLVVGVIPLLIVLMLPALSRRSRRARSRRRTRL